MKKDFNELTLDIFSRLVEISIYKTKISNKIIKVDRLKKYQTCLNEGDKIEFYLTKDGIQMEIHSKIQCSLGVHRNLDSDITLIERDGTSHNISITRNELATDPMTLETKRALSSIKIISDRYVGSVKANLIEYYDEANKEDFDLIIEPENITSNSEKILLDIRDILDKLGLNYYAQIENPDELKSDIDKIQDIQDSEWDRI